MNQFEVTIDNYGHSGEGVGKVAGKPVFVQGAMAGERVCIAYTERKKTFSRARVTRLMTTSPERVTPQCAIYESCGGCQLQHMSYAEQLRFKRQSVVNAIERIGGMSKELVGAIVPAVLTTYYRNKMQLPVQASADGLVAGFFAQGSHSVIDMQQCVIQHRGNNEIARVVRQIATQLGLEPYNEVMRTGWLRHIVGRIGVNTNQWMLIIVTTSKDFAQSAQFISAVTKQLPDLKTIIQNVNADDTNVIFGREDIVLWGSPTIRERICGLEFEIAARSFFQVNSTQVEQLYSIALEQAGLTSADVLLDAYCGAGTIGLTFARRCARVVGVDIIAPAIDNARRNALLNNITNTEYHCGDITALLPALIESEHPTVVVVDPPRTGCAESELVIYRDVLKPRRIVYVSCNPATLARDVKILCSSGEYTCASVTPVDMFPQTFHVESVTILNRK